jgi:hypothetical protein
MVHGGSYNLFINHLYVIDFFMVAEDDNSTDHQSKKHCDNWSEKIERNIKWNKEEDIDHHDKKNILHI